jgi:peptidoglycan lytic transglycosylase D
VAALAVTGCASSTAGGGAKPADDAVRITYSDAESAASVRPPVADLAADPAGVADAVEPAEPVELGEAPTEEVAEELGVAGALAASLEAYESAEVFWQEGSDDDAFAALDHSYELMSSVETNGDPMVLQEKEDLRRLISRRVVEIYAARHTAVGQVERSIPLDINSYVEREIKSFQTAERASFLEAYARSGRYRPFILEQLGERGMPERLSWLPVVESWFKVRAFSSARALGLWQFIASTGYRFGLQRSSWHDERMDPEKATAAAAAYLSDLHDLFGDWLTALAAYNCGESRVLRVIQAQRVSYFDRFWDLYELLPQETRRFVPRFLATVAIVEDPEKYGFNDLPEPMPRLDYDEVETARPLRLADLEKAAGLESGSLVALNPELRLGGTPESAYSLKVPVGHGPTLLSAVDQVPRFSAPVVATSVYRVRPGETLSGIADRNHTSVANLMRLNGLSNPNRLWPGQNLKVSGVADSSPLAPGESIAYTVRSGDSLWGIAKRHGTTVDAIRADNGLRSDTLLPGQRLTLRGGSRSGGAASGGTYVVRSGDTLGGIADRNRVSLQRLADANGISTRSTIYPGQRLVIPQ